MHEAFELTAVRDKQRTLLLQTPFVGVSIIHLICFNTLHVFVCLSEFVRYHNEG